mmetsp:Transcript_13491/g.34972  ORF Transcript_13491/g.34972 Transcript_13491/m.34972 type:complete len:83 (+) Transcript_13491:47-295(+)
MPTTSRLQPHENLTPKVQMLREWGLADSQLVDILSRFPQLFTYSSKRLAHRKAVLEAHGSFTGKSLTSVMSLTDVKFIARFK